MRETKSVRCISASLVLEDRLISIHFSSYYNYLVEAIFGLISSRTVKLQFKFAVCMHCMSQT